MTRLLTVLAISVALGAAFAVACGGPDKPPLTPDTDTPTDGADASAAPTSSAAPK
ncbi:MAG TPA: hypothetical protein VIF62_34235 [Labilithrix sp.]|jgi:hypothetical protein